MAAIPDPMTATRIPAFHGRARQIEISTGSARYRDRTQCATVPAHEILVRLSLLPVASKFQKPLQ
jgi:hypothetical protein